MSDLLSNRIEAALAGRHAGAVLAGLSGGLDSCVLLHALSRSASVQALGLRAMHVHHGLQPQAGDWAQHCQGLCDALSLPLTIAHVSVELDRGDGLEAAARAARHEAFAAALHGGEILALAHHGQDQSETFLLRAMRASGADGLASMRPWRRLGRGWLWRPWLDVPREELVAYARAHALDWIEDPGNEDIERDRNFLRHRVLPLLRERWPGADAAFARSATLLAEAADLLADEDAAALATASTIDPRVLSLHALQRLPAPRRARVLRRWIAAIGLPPLPAKGIGRIESDLLHARPDATVAFAWSGAVIRRWRNHLHADRPCAPWPDDYCVEWDSASALRLPNGDRLALVSAAPRQTWDRYPVPMAGGARDPVTAVPAFGQPLSVHARKGGERITLPGRSHSHALKHVLQDLGVPPWQRERLPVLSTADGEVMAAGDLVHSARFDSWLRDHGCRLEWACDPQQSMP